MNPYAALGAGLLAVALLAGCKVMETTPGSRLDVWIDCDPAAGLPERDVDDGLALIQAFHSPELNVRGVSIVFGNADLNPAMEIGREVVKRYGPRGMEVHAGAAGPEDFGKENAAVRAMAQALMRGRLTILPIGPVTNVGTLVKLHPELHGRIEAIVMVAARRPGQRFVIRPEQEKGFRDFNFELDPAAMRAILETEIPIVFAPWEVSSHVWITRDDLRALRESGGSGAWIAEKSMNWIEMWETKFGARGFNPFDTLAIGWLTHPGLIESDAVGVWIEEQLDDTATAEERAAGRSKPYLLVNPTKQTGRQAVYCFRPKAGFKAVLMERLAGGRMRIN